MAPSKKKSKAGIWTCPHGCNQTAWFNKKERRNGKLVSRHRGCPHLEKLLPGSHRGDSSVIYDPNPERFLLADVSDNKSLTDEEEVCAEPISDYDRMLGSLRKAGLSEKLSKVVALRIVGGMSWEEIALECGCTSKGSVYVEFARAIKFLKKVGYGQSNKT